MAETRQDFRIGREPRQFDGYAQREPARGAVRARRAVALPSVHPPRKSSARRLNDGPPVLRI